jgi:hypothetical protein
MCKKILYQQCFSQNSQGDHEMQKGANMGVKIARLKLEGRKCTIRKYGEQNCNLPYILIHLYIP